MSLLVIVYAAGLGQAALLLAALAAMRVHNRQALAALISIVVLFSVVLAENLQIELGAGRALGVGLTIEFALAPLFLLLVRSLYRGPIELTPFDLIHFAPFLVSCALLVWLNLGFPGYVSLSNSSMRWVVASIVLAKIVWACAYMVIAARQPIPADISAERRDALRGFRAVFLVFVAVYMAMALMFVAFLADAPFAPDSDVIGGLIVAASLYAIGYFSLVRRDIFDRRERYARSAMPAGEAAAVRARVVAFLKTDERFRTPDLSLGQIARALGVSAAQLSQALNAEGEGGFNALLNHIRLEAFAVARARPDNASKTVLDIAFEVGFNSKATFYRAQQAIAAATAESGGSNVSAN